MQNPSSIVYADDRDAGWGYATSCEKSGQGKWRRNRAIGKDVGSQSHRIDSGGYKDGYSKT